MTRQKGGGKKEVCQFGKEEDLFLSRKAVRKWSAPFWWQGGRRKGEKTTVCVGGREKLRTALGKKKKNWFRGRGGADGCVGAGGGGGGEKRFALSFRERKGPFQEDLHRGRAPLPPKGRRVLRKGPLEGVTWFLFGGKKKETTP